MFSQRWCDIFFKKQLWILTLEIGALASSLFFSDFIWMHLSAKPKNENILPKQRNNSGIDPGRGSGRARERLQCDIIVIAGISKVLLWESHHCRLIKLLFFPPQQGSLDGVLQWAFHNISRPLSESHGFYQWQLQIHNILACLPPKTTNKFYLNVQKSYLLYYPGAMKSKEKVDLPFLFLFIF